MKRIASRTILPTLSTSSMGLVLPVFLSWSFGMVISPARMTTLDFTIVSQATRLVRSTARQASSTLSEMRSATLSGWPSPTDSEEKTKELDMGTKNEKGARQHRKPNVGVGQTSLSAAAWALTPDGI